MLHVDFTKHAQERLQQRGFRNADVNLVLEVASEVGPKVYVLTDQDAAREIQQRKQEIQKLERLRGATLVIEDGRLITMYHGRDDILKGSPKKR
jgi:predicted sugar kinase